MDANEIAGQVTAAVEARLQEFSTAKLVPLTAMIAGQQMALVALISALHNKGSLTLDESERAVRGALEALSPEHAKSQSGASLRRLLEHFSITRVHILWRRSSWRIRLA